MVRNIVFDFGNVLVRFEPVKYILPFVDGDEKLAEKLSDMIFLSKPWKAGDRGLMGRAEIIDAVCAAHPDQAELIRRIMVPCDEMLTMPEDTPVYLNELKEAGYRLYCITNTNDAAYTYMLRTHKVLGELHGGLASFQEGILKPEPAIFELLCSRYGLKPEECVFVDDMPENTAAAEACGFQSVTLPSADRLRECLGAYLAGQK
ncbi:MAG: HAD family phosphatase [Clostridia bacterium]|nr:HAD family phosphatase [Clostridia bacterium]